jgi:hypothetical protein
MHNCMDVPAAQDVEDRHGAIGGAHAQVENLRGGTMCFASGYDVDQDATSVPNVEAAILVAADNSVRVEKFRAQKHLRRGEQVILRNTCFEYAVGPAASMMLVAP